MKTKENARASAKSIERCRSGAGSARPPRAGASLLCALGLALSAGCDDPAQPGAGTGGAGTGSGGAAGTGMGGNGGVAGTCPDGEGLQLGVASRANEGSAHVIFCDPVSYQSEPPSSGSHYPNWLDYKTYAQPVPWGFMVHGLEHGAVVVVYNCPGGCADEVATAQAWIDALPMDANCGARPRVILAPDPTLSVRWAASAWTWTLRACAFDQAMFQQFFAEHYDAAPESICGGGGDRSATGWCP